MKALKSPIHLVELSGISILQQLRWEEALLRADDRNWCLFNRGSSPAIVLGISGQVDQLIHREKLQKVPVPLIRRFSGGGTVIVDENTLFVTFICQSSALPISPFPRHLLEWTAELYRPLFASQPFQLQENDYVFGEKKWGGNAQSIIKGRWLHHSSLLWDYSLEFMNYLLLPPKMPSYRQRRGHADFLCKLRDYYPTSASLQMQLIEQLSTYFRLIETDSQELNQVSLRPHRKTTTLIE